MRLVLLLAALASVLLGSPAVAQPVPGAVGDWSGALSTPRGGLTLILHVKGSDRGPLTATLESPDQGPGEMPATEIAVTGGHMSWKIASIGASYQADWDAAKNQWRGTFSQGGAELPLTLARGLPPAKPLVAGLDGRWEGTIELNGVKLRLVTRIATGARGTAANLDSPDQLAYGIPIASLAHSGQSVAYDVPAVKAHYAGTLSADGGTIVGAWTQPGISAPVTFTRAQTAQASPPSRPQTPRPPFPYKSEEVTFDNAVQKGVRLGGTLTLPQGKGPYPAAVLITDSGAQDRDETILGHKPFAVIADYLTRRGIAVLRFDDRGVGQSTGNYAAATSADLATDANAAANYLMTRADIRHDAVGFIGHSEGGMIGPIAMASNDRIAFLIMMAGPGTALDKLMLSQRRLVGSQMGMSELQLDRAEPVMAAVFHAIAAADTPAAGKEAARAVLTPAAMTMLGAPGVAPDVILNQVTGPWFSYFLKYDPLPNLRRIKVPLLAMGGSLDRQVPPEENLAAIKAATAGDRDVTVVELPGLNHLFQTARTGAVGEYADIQETVAPSALQTMGDWLTSRFAAK